LSSYRSQTEAGQSVQCSLQRMRDARRAGDRQSRIRHDILDPAHHWMSACAFFRSSTGSPVEAARSARSIQTSAFGRLYRLMQEVELPVWTSYLKHRVERRGWLGEAVLVGLSTLPRSTPQAQRWCLMRLHLNGLMNGARAHAARVVTSPGMCVFCRAGPDSTAHLLHCDVVRGAQQQLQQVSHNSLTPVVMSDLFFQTAQDGAQRAFASALLLAIWDARRQCLNTTHSRSADTLMPLLVQLLECPWVLNAIPTRLRRERRAARLRELPPVEGAICYRSDGASRRTGDAREAGFGGARWSMASMGRGPPEATVKGYLGDCTNNVAEYAGLEAVMGNAVAHAVSGQSFLFEVDSNLLAKQVQAFGRNRYACRSQALWPQWSRCTLYGKRLEQAGCAWQIRHIYREYNTTADQLANEGINEGLRETCSATW